MKLLQAQHIRYPEYYKEYAVGQLDNFYNYHTKRMTTSQSYRLSCLMNNLDIHGLRYPIIVSEHGYRVSVGHQRVWYAVQRGYTHVSCYHVPNREIEERIRKTDCSDEYWKKPLQEKNL